jgi:hypothetical protein
LEKLTRGRGPEYFNWSERPDDFRTSRMAFWWGTVKSARYRCALIDTAPLFIPVSLDIARKHRIYSAPAQRESWRLSLLNVPAASLY